MRIALVNQYYPPAEAPTAVLAADLMEALAARGHEAHVITSARAYNDPSRTYPREETVRGVRVWRVRSSGFGRGGKLGRMVDYVTFLLGARRRLGRLSRPDLVIAMTSPPMLVRALLPVCRRRGTRLLYWAMDLYPDVAFALGVLRPEGWIGRALTRAARQSVAAADRVVALGPAMAERLRAQGANRVDVIDNWCDGSKIRPRPREGHPLRRRNGWDGKFVVLYSGNMGLAHEFDTVLDAAAELRQRADIVFAFVGGGARLEEIRRGARERGLEVEFHPWVETPQLAEGLTAGDVHLITMLDAAVGLLVPSKIYGVLAAGRPALYVGPRRSTIAAILDTANCGATIRAGRSADLAAWIRRYADDGELRESHGTNARQAFEQGYDRPHALRKFTEIVESCEGQG